MRGRLGIINGQKVFTDEAHTTEQWDRMMIKLGPRIASKAVTAPGQGETMESADTGNEWPRLEP